MNLESSVERSQTARNLRNRPRSGDTHLVSLIEGADARFHETSQGLGSGQLRIPG